MAIRLNTPRFLIAVSESSLNPCSSNHRGLLPQFDVSRTKMRAVTSTILFLAMLVSAPANQIEGIYFPKEKVEKKTLLRIGPEGKFEVEDAGYLLKGEWKRKGDLITVTFKHAVSNLGLVEEELLFSIQEKKGIYYLRQQYEISPDSTEDGINVIDVFWPFPRTWTKKANQSVGQIPSTRGARD